MGKVPKKPNKRRNTKKSSSTETQVNVGDIGYKRILQANAIREQIRKNLGDIFNEISSFELTLASWASTGKSAQGKCEIPSLEKELEWRLHSDILKYPEVWVRDN